MLKTLIYQGIIIVIFFSVFLSKNTILPTFQLTNAPNIITKGHYGATLIVEISYSHNGLEEWLQQLHEPYPLVLADTDWLMRSENVVKLLQEKKIPVGLLGKASSMYEDRLLLEKELTAFGQILQQDPLWFATRDDLIDSLLLEQLFKRQINALSPTTTFPIAPSEGEFVAIRLHRDSSIDFKQIEHYMNSHKFISIEESLFGYTISTKRYP